MSRPSKSIKASSMPKMNYLKSEPYHVNIHKRAEDMHILQKVLDGDSEEWFMTFLLKSLHELGVFDFLMRGVKYPRPSTR